MKKYTLTLLLTAAPLFAGSPAPVAPAPQYNSEQGFTLGLEPMALRAFGSNGGFDKSDYEFAGRGSLGYQFADGVFVKATYFDFGSDVTDHSVVAPQSLVAPLAAGSLDKFTGRLAASYIDLVIGQDFKPTEGLKLSPYAGLRWAMLQQGETETLTSPYPAHAVMTGQWASRMNFEGLGIVVGIDATRALGSSFSVYGTAKETIAFGTTDNGDSAYNSNVSGVTTTHSNNSDTVVSISELGLGVQYDFCFSNVAANVRLGVEGQWWSGVNGGNLFGNGGDSVGLAGFVLGANFRF